MTHACGALALCGAGVRASSAPVWRPYNAAMTGTETLQETAARDDAPVHEDRLWIDRGWTAQVIKNEDDDGWAVAMYRDGEAEPALVGPWTMGRDKKNPKPLDAAAFSTLVKTASEVIRRAEQHLHAQLHKRLTVNAEAGAIEVRLDIVPDDDDPHALLSAFDAAGDELARVRVRPDFSLSQRTASAWIDADFRRPV